MGNRFCGICRQSESRPQAAWTGSECCTQIHKDNVELEEHLCQDSGGGKQLEFSDQILGKGTVAT